MPTSSIDPTGQYFSSTISKNGRNEVQIYSIKEDLLVQDQSVKIILDATDEIIDSTWILETSKRRKRGVDEEQSESSDDKITLVVLVKSGEFLTFIPQSDKVVGRISTGRLISSIISLAGDVWGTSLESKEIYQFSIEGQVKKTVKSAEISNKIIEVAGKIITAGTSLHILKGKKNVTVELGEGNVKFLTSLGENVYVGKAHEVLVINTLKGEITQRYSVADEILQLFVRNIASPNIFVIKKDSIEEIYPTPSTLTTPQTISNIYESNEDLIAIWYNQNEPNFTPINLLNEEKAEPIAIEYSGPASLILPIQLSIDNLDQDDLYNQLSQLLDSDSTQSVIILCSTNNNSENIKQTIKQLSSSPETTALLNKLFPIISKEVASDPSSSGALAIWLKWILLIHGGSIGKEQQSELGTLETGLAGGLKLMPHLIALQGRLQLLKLQGELRAREVEPEFERTNEEGVVFENGEEA